MGKGGRMSFEAIGVPTLKELIGALIFGANRPIGTKELRQCILEVAAADADAGVYAEVSTKDIEHALGALQDDLKRQQSGFLLHEVAGGWRLQSNPACGRWLKHLLQIKPQRLSQPALETMAIIAYRQPISKAEIESIRGVGVSHIIKALLEMQLIKIAGRSELPGRPFLYGTTARFLEHFGLKALKDLERIGPRVFSRKIQAVDAQASRAAEADGRAGGGEPVSGEEGSEFQEEIFEEGT